MISLFWTRKNFRLSLLTGSMLTRCYKYFINTIIISEMQGPKTCSEGLIWTYVVIPGWLYIFEKQQPCVSRLPGSTELAAARLVVDRPRCSAASRVTCLGDRSRTISERSNGEWQTRIHTTNLTWPSPLPSFL